MKNLAVLSAVALLAAAGAANAQSSLAGATLELRIVPVDGTAAGGLTRPGANADVGLNDTNRTRRFEVQYRINDPNGIAAGLSSMQFNITGTLVGGSGVGFALDRAELTRFQGQTGNLQPGNTGLAVSPGGSDTTGASTIGHRGLHRPFRGGIPAPAPNNNNPANGIIPIGAQAINLITPLALSQSDQNDGGFYGLYSFTVDVGPANAGIDPDNDGFANILLVASPVADGQTGNRWGGFEFDNPVPQTSQNAINGVANVRVEIPAPGSLALVGLGGLLAARRRRA